MDLEKINKELKNKTPQEIVSWALENGNNPVVTTNFRPYESAILHVTTSVLPEIKVIWCDTGYNTPNTYKHAHDIIKMLDLNLFMYVPKQSVGFRNTVLGIPEVDTPEHDLFTQQVKLEPFKRAMTEHQPDLWFTNLRKGQTTFRDSINIVSQGSDGVLKVSPFYHWTNEELDEYLEAKAIPNEHKYYDPTKVLSNRECGLHA
jgi:phosphoadenosine phosphosulfate reductase